MLIPFLKIMSIKSFLLWLDENCFNLAWNIGISCTDPMFNPFIFIYLNVVLVLSNKKND